MIDKAMLTEEQIKITPYAGNANRVTVEIDGVFFWCPKPFADMALAYLRAREDAERIDQIEKCRATIYKSSGHWVFVDERVDKHTDRRGILGKTLRKTIDAARKGAA